MNLIDTGLNKWLKEVFVEHGNIYNDFKLTLNEKSGREHNIDVYLTPSVVSGNSTKVSFSSKSGNLVDIPVGFTLETATVHCLGGVVFNDDDISNIPFPNGGKVQINNISLVFG